MGVFPPLRAPPPPLLPPEELQPAAVSAAAAAAAPMAMKRVCRRARRGLPSPGYGGFAVDIWSLLIPYRGVLPTRQRTRNSPELKTAGYRRSYPLTEPTVRPDAM